MIPLHTPITLACEWWHRNMSPNANFASTVEWFLQHGTVYSDDHLFILARPWEVSVGLFEPAPKPDTWLIYLAATNGVTPLRRFMEIAPFPLPLVAFHRRGAIKLYTWAKLQEKLHLETHGLNR